MTHPYLPLYVDDFEAATAHLTIEEDGVYNRLLRLCWRTPGCSIPNEPTWIARKIRLSADDFERVAKPVIEEFFKVQRGRLIQKRLKEEYDNISRKKSARKKAGSAGGSQKALNAKENPPSNATVLPAHTRAFPEPYPEPEGKKEANASSVAGATPKPKARTYPEAFEAAWKAYPHHKGRSSKPNAAAAWAKLPADERAGLVVAIGRFAPNVGETCGGKGAPDMAVWLKDGKHLNWGVGQDDPLSPAAPTFNAPAVRASIVQATDEDFARSYVDHYCRWVQSGRRLEASKPAVLAILTGRLSAWAKAKDVTIALASANDTPPLFAEEDAA